MRRANLLLSRCNGLQNAVRWCTVERNAVYRSTYHCAQSNRLICPTLRYCSGEAGNGSVAMEEIAPEMVTIEILPAETEYPFCNNGESDCSTERLQYTNGSNSTTVAGDGAHGAGRAMQQQAYWDVTSIDHFAKSRVLNYVRRTGNQSSSVFEVSEELMFGKTVYRARCRLPLPAPHHLYVAEGVGDEEKDAVLLAAMHAERVCDSLGVPLFRLPLMQKKHAENARRQGRYAPMPGDPVKPENTITPPPLRMVSIPNPQDRSGVKAAFASSIAEAEIISDCGTARPRDLRSPVRAVEGLNATPSASAVSGNDVVRQEGGEEEEEEGGNGGVSYHTTVHYPWLFGGREGTGGGVTNQAVSGQSGSACFDPTEGGLWQMVNTTSTRCSPSADALLLPCVYETAAHERMKDHFLGQGVALRDRITFTHVAVANHSTRMYVAELCLYDTIVARGKAQTKECAERLAAMHGELLLDALARPLFPHDADRQARHAEAVSRFGRWAPNPKTGDLQHPRPHDVLPLPLKQQVGGDEVWMDPVMLRRCGYQRSTSERIISAHVEINNYCGDYIEANPDPALLVEARQALEAWQRDVARNPFLDMFVITRMGDQFRASTLLPVPRKFGVRGGNGVGKTMEQAIDLCALHAVDTLCALGIPVFADRKKQLAFVEERRKRGLVTADVMRGLKRKNGLVAIPAPSLQLERNPTSENPSTAGSCSEDNKGEVRSERPPYLPGYMVEGNQPRPLPHICDTLHVLQLRIPEDFVVYGEELADEAIIEAGNEAKVCVQNYLRVQLPKSANVNASVYITGYGRQVSVHNIAYLPLALPQKKEGGNSKGSVSSENENNVRFLHTVTKKSSGLLKVEQVYQRSEGGDATVTCDATIRTAGGENSPSFVRSGGSQDEKEVMKPMERLLAVGISLKKKDAERMCYLHAVEILRTNGVDVLLTYRSGLPRRKGLQLAAEPPLMPVEETKSGGDLATVAAATAKSTEKCGVQRKESSSVAESEQRSSSPKPYMHKLMKNFMESGKHYTPAKRRASPGQYSPF